MRIVIAPSCFAAAVRSTVVLGAVVLVGVLMLEAKGAPERSRDVHRNEVELFAARPSAVIQFGGELLLVAVVAWGCREPLKIRL